MRFQKYPDSCARGLGNFNNTRIKERALYFERDLKIARAWLSADWPGGFFWPQLHLGQYIERGFNKLKDIKGKENTRHLPDAWLSVAQQSMVSEELARNSRKRLLLSDHTRNTSLAILFLCVCSIEDFLLVAMWRGTILISVDGVRKGLPFCRKWFINSVKSRTSRQNVAWGNKD